MRNQWYGDKRDFIKWPTLLYLAKREGIARIFQVAMKTDSEPPGPEITTLNGSEVVCEKIAAQVAGYFYGHNDLSGIRVVGKQFGIGIVVWSRIFKHAKRDAYFKDILAEVQKSECPTIWFFDPDTGIEPPSGAKKTHVKLAELAGVFQLMPEGDYLACYQHARREKEWIWQNEVRKSLSDELKVKVDSVEVFTSAYAPDVIFLAVRK